MSSDLQFPFEHPVWPDFIILGYGVPAAEQHFVNLTGKKGLYGVIKPLFEARGFLDRPGKTPEDHGWISGCDGMYSNAYYAVFRNSDMYQELVPYYPDLDKLNTIPATPHDF